MKTHSKPICKSHKRHTNQNLQIRLLLQPAFTICFILLFQFLFSQNSKIDSLHALLKTDKEDTNKVNHLNKLFGDYIYSSPDTALNYAQQALKLSEKINWKKGIANSFGNLGVCYRLKADYPKALDYYLKALMIDEELKDKSGMTKRLGNIGTVYSQQADYPKALDFYLKALKMAEELGDKNIEAKWLGNIGIVYRNQAD